MAGLPRLVTNKYDRPKETYQDTLQNKKSMLEKLENYERVENIEEVPIKTHIRYVTLHNETKKQIFRVGGILEAVHPKYILLSNGEFKWSVQRYHYCDDASTEEPVFETVYWRKLSKEEQVTIQKNELQEQLNDLEQRYNELLEENQKLKTYIENNL
tara:strand:- start:8441 stop:8911 length:471 start_codon:yes stop_codon:yes gene_type:complete